MLSTNGNDENSGSKSAPLRSFSAVLEKTRALDGEKTVIIEAGRYTFRKTLELDGRDSGTHFVADGEVFFDGGVVLDNSKIEDYKDGIKMVDLSDLGVEFGELGNRGFRRASINSPSEFFLNGGAQKIARYPKTRIILYEENDIVDSGSRPCDKDYTCRPATLRLDQEKTKKWANAKHAYLGGVDVTSPIWREKYPYLYETYKNDYRPEWMYYNNALLYHKYDCFVDARNGDFTQIDGFREKFYRDEYDWQRRTDVIMGYDNDLVHPHRVDFKSIGLIKK